MTGETARADEKKKQTIQTKFTMFGGGETSLATQNPTPGDNIDNL